MEYLYFQEAEASEFSCCLFYQSLDLATVPSIKATKHVTL